MTEQSGKNDFRQRFILQFEKLTAGDPLPSLLVALSGGADSVLLLHLLNRISLEQGFVLEAYHLNHCIRGEEAKADAAFCEELCRALDVPFHLETAEIPALAAKAGLGIEECARIRRYEDLGRICKERGLSYIVTGHNADDQLETMLFRLARGSSLKGLCGIPEKRGQIIRPLLSFGSLEIREYCKEMGFAYRVDSTNDSTEYARNDIRKNILPVLERVHKGAAKRAFFTAQCLREEDELLSSMVPQEELSHEELLRLHPALLRRYLEKKYSAFEPDGLLEGKHLLDLCGLVKKGAYGKALSLPHLVKATLYQEGIVFSRDQKQNQSVPFSPLPVDEKGVELPCGNIYVMNRKKFDEFCLKNRKIHRLFIKETCNSATIEGALMVRYAKKGDRVRIGGMTKKIFSLLGEMKVPLKNRECYPVVTDDRGVLWLPGKAARDGCAQKEGDLVLVFVDFQK